MVCSGKSDNVFILWGCGFHVSRAMNFHKKTMIFMVCLSHFFGLENYGLQNQKMIDHQEPHLSTLQHQCQYGVQNPLTYLFGVEICWISIGCLEPCTEMPQSG